MFISKAEFPRYKGLEELVPGHIYLDDKGVRIIFLGRGVYKRIQRVNGGPIPGWGTKDNCFLYMKYDNVIKKINAGKLSADLTRFCGGDENATDFWKTVFFSQQPRNLMSDEGVFCDDKKFIHLIVKDTTNDVQFASIKPECEYHIITK